MNPFSKTIKEMNLKENKQLIFQSRKENKKINQATNKFNQ